MTGSATSTSRRTFLQTSLAAGGALLLGFRLPLAAASGTQAHVASSR
jgi:hypothetical protein